MRNQQSYVSDKRPIPNHYQEYGQMVWQGSLPDVTRKSPQSKCAFKTKPFSTKKVISTLNLNQGILNKNVHKASASLRSFHDRVPHSFDYDYDDECPILLTMMMMMVMMTDDDDDDVDDADDVVCEIATFLSWYQCVNGSHREPRWPSKLRHLTCDV